MYRIFLVTAVSYFIAAAGLFSGAALAFLLPSLTGHSASRSPLRPRHTFFSLFSPPASGMAIALVGFELFPAALSASNLYFTALSVMGGVLLLYLAETGNGLAAGYNEAFIYLLACGTAAALFFGRSGAELSVPLIIAISLIPAGMENKNLFRSFALASVMAAGGLTGALAGLLPEPLPSALLSASAGAILYISSDSASKRGGVSKASELLSWGAVIIGFIFAVILIELF